MIYRTDDPARWGVGKGANLTPVEVDGNFWELLSRVVTLETSGASPNGIDTITVVGSQMTVYLDDGTALGPYTLPTAMIRYRGDWVPGAAYVELDLVAVPNSGVYLVLRDHTAAATFDASATDADGNSLYRWLFPMVGHSTFLDLTDTPAGYGAAGTLVAMNATGTGLEFIAPPASSLDGLSDVTITTPAAAQVLQYDGAAWVNSPLAWAEIPDKPATFPPSAHGHPSSEISDFAEAVQDTVGAMAIGGTNVTVTYDDVAGTLTISSSGGGGASVSDEGVQILAAPTDVNFAGAGVSVADDADGTVTVTIPGGGATAISDEGAQVLAAPSDVNFAGAGVSVANDGDGTVTVTIPGGGSTSASDEGMLVLAGPSDLNFAGAGVSVTDDGDGTVTITIPGGGAAALDDLSDVTITTPATGQVLQFDGAGWVNSTLAWGEITEKPATFPPEAHTHPSTQISDFAEAVDDRVAALFVAGANITLTYDDVANTFTIAAASGSAASVSHEGAQILAAPTDLNFAGAGVSVADDGDGTATVTIPGGIAEAPSDGKLYGRKNATWAVVALPAAEGAYSYWRLRLISEDQLSGTNQVYTSELQFRSEVGVAEQATGGTAFGTGASQGAYDGLFDNNLTSSSWAPGEPYTDKHVGYQFAAPKSVAEVALYIPNNLYPYAPRRFAIEASNDGTTWTEILRLDPCDPWSSANNNGVPKTWEVPQPADTVDWAKVENKPATVAALPGPVGAAGTVLKAQADGTVAWAADESGGGGGTGGSYTFPDHAPPLASWFPTLVGAPTLTEDAGGLRFDGAASGGQIRAGFKALPAANTTVTTKLDPTTRFEANFTGSGIILRDTASGRYLVIGTMSVNGKPWTEMAEFSSATTFSAAVAGSSRQWEGSAPTWFRAEYDHATKAITGFYSFDGQNWVQMATSSWLAAPDEFGLGLAIRNSSFPGTGRFTYYDDGTQKGETISVGGANHRSARGSITSFNIGTAATWTKMAMALGHDVGSAGFDDANDQFVVPSGVSLVRLTACLERTAGTAGNQFRPFKNGARLELADGGFSFDVTPSGYSNSGTPAVSAAIPVAAGDTIDLRGYVGGSSTFTGWFEMEILA